MYHYRCYREEFLDIVVNSKEIKPLSLANNDFDEPKPEDIDLYWDNWDDKKDSFIKLPDFIVINSNHAKDFFAWTSTYISSVHPLTSYTHVLEYHDFMTITSCRDKRITHRIVKGFTGAIIGEVMANCATQDFPLTPSVSYLYFASKAFSLGYDTINLNKLYKKYEAFQYFFSLKCALISFDDCKAIIDLLIALNDSTTSRNGDRLLELIKSLVECGFDTAEAIAKFDNHLDSSLKATEIMPLSKDKRYSLIKEIIHSSGYIDDPVIHFKMAYLANLIAPGTLTHFGIFDKHGNRNKMYLWYGLCGGLSSSNDIFGFNDNFGQRIYQKISQFNPVINSPTCDISLTEMLSLFTNKNTFVQYFNLHRYFIGLLPNIDIEIESSISEKNDINPRIKQNCTNIINVLQSNVDALKKCLSIDVAAKEKGKPANKKNSKKNTLF